MDRRIATMDQLPTEEEFMEAQRFAYEAIGIFAFDVLGAPAVAFAASFPCTPTLVPSLSFVLGPGRLYQLQDLDATPMGQTDGDGGLGADTNPDHAILKQGLYRDTHTLGPLVAPTTTGQSQVFLVQAQFSEADDAPTLTQFYNTTAPDTPIAAPVTLARRDIVIVEIKNGIATTTGAQTIPAADAGWVPLYAITLAHGQTTIGTADIALAPGAPFATALAPARLMEKDHPLTIVAGVLTIDWSAGNDFTVLMNANITSVVHQNRPPSGLWQEITIDFVGDGTTRTLAGLGSADHKWMGDTAPATQPTFVFTAGYENTVIMVAKNGVARQKCSFPGISAA